MIPRALAWIFVTLSLLSAIAGQAGAAKQAAAERQNLVTNGGAEELDVNGDLAAWSVYVRTGKATLKQTTEDKTEGSAAARLEVDGEGATFDVRTGRSVVPELKAGATYMFTADVKWNAGDDAEPSANFCLGVGNSEGITDVSVGTLRRHDGWQKVGVKFAVPANQQLLRLELSGGSAGAAVVLIDNVRIRVAKPGEEAPQEDSPEAAVKLEAGVPMLVKKILPTDCRLVRSFTHAPVDGRVDTRYATGDVSEWSGMRSLPGTHGYWLFNGNNGLHVALAEPSVDAVQIRGGWRGRLYADVDVLTKPGPGVPAVCEIRPKSGVFRRIFTPQVRARRLSFFYQDDQHEPLADVTFLQVRAGQRFQPSADDATFELGESADPDAALRQAIEARFGPNYRAHCLGDAAGEAVPLHKGEFVHLISPPQEPSRGIAAVTLKLHISQVQPGTMLTVRVHDVLDPRRESMATDFQVPGPGTYTVTLDTPDQVFLPPQESWSRPPRLDGPIAPPPVLWVSLGAETPMTIERTQVTLHRVAREKALGEAGAWRKFLLTGLFKTMSEPRPWLSLDEKTPIRQQIESKEAFKPYRTTLIELLENAEAARLLLPDDDIVWQYHDWLYQSLDEKKPQPPNLPAAAGAPEWAVLVRENWRELNHIATWWLDNRLVADGEFGGHPGDDTDLFQTWQCLPMIESEPLGARLKDAAARLSDLVWEHKLEEGLNERTMDALHAYEDGINQVSLCAWWFYGDPVHYERVMASARSAMKLMVETPDGRLHFGSNDVGIEQARHGYEKLGVTAGHANWAPIRLMLHPMYVAALYNRNPTILEKFERWGQTWANYQQPGAYVGQVEILTGKPTKVSKLPSAEAAGPVDEWLALYHITSNPKWQEPFELLMDSGGYWGTSVGYGRLPHALVRWKESYQQRMRERFNEPEHGYAGFFLHKDRDLLRQHLVDSASWFGRFRHIHTAAEQKTDRVLTYKATTPIACYLGDAPNRNRWLNFTAVSYENLRGEDFAALVWDAGPDVLRVALYNFQDRPLDGLMRVWRLDHGRYRVRIGPDQNDDGILDSAALERTLELQRYSPLDVTLPPRQVTIVEVELVERLDDIVERADVAVSPIDTRLDDNGKLEVKVHNIGAKPARDVRVSLLRGGQVTASETIGEIQAPIDLQPKVVSVWFDGGKVGDVVQLDPEQRIAEIAEHNNRLTVQAPLPRESGKRSGVEP